MITVCILAFENIMKEPILDTKFFDFVPRSVMINRNAYELLLRNQVALLRN